MCSNYEKQLQGIQTQEAETRDQVSAWPSLGGTLSWDSLEYLPVPTLAWSRAGSARKGLEEAAELLCRAGLGDPASAPERGHLLGLKSVGLLGAASVIMLTS